MAERCNFCVMGEGLSARPPSLSLASTPATRPCTHRVRSECETGTK